MQARACHTTAEATEHECGNPPIDREQDSDAIGADVPSTGVQAKLEHLVQSNVCPAFRQPSKFHMNQLIQSGR